MGMSKLQGKINNRSENKEDALAEAVVDLCFFTSYKIEELLKMPTKRLNILLDRLILWRKVKLGAVGIKQ